MKSRLLLPICVLACAVAVQSCAQAQSSPIKAQPIYEPCAKLSAGTDETVARAIAMLKSQDAKARAQAAQQLSAPCDNRAVEPLIDVLKDADAEVRIAALTALGKLGDPTSVDPLLELVFDKEPRVKTALISALASFKTFNARNAVINSIANPSGAEVSDDDDMLIRCQAILTANQLKDPTYSRKAILFLVSLLESKHSNIRKLAEQTMLELKNTRNAATELAAIVKQDHNPALRRWAVVWVGKIGFDNSRETLQQAANDTDPGVRDAATAALKQLP